MSSTVKQIVIPKIEDLTFDVEQAFKDSQFKLLLNQKPKDSWLENHPMATVKGSDGRQVPAKYLPIDKVEFLLDYLFQEWRIEVIGMCPMFQSISVHVRVHYRNPVSGEWSFHDGVGAKSVQVNKGASAADLAEIKDAAVQMALPSAKTYAIKDACDHLGKIFGRDVNRKGTIDFVNPFPESVKEKSKTEQKEEERIITLIETCKSLPILKTYEKHCKSQESCLAYDKKFKEMST